MSYDCTTSYSTTEPSTTEWPSDGGGCATAPALRVETDLAADLVADLTGALALAGELGAARSRARRRPSASA